MTTDGTRRERLTLARDALAIVLTSVVLGVAFNALGRSSRPPRGMPWITEARPLASVDEEGVDGEPSVLAPPNAMAAPAATSVARRAGSPLSHTGAGDPPSTGSAAAPSASEPAGSAVSPAFGSATDAASPASGHGTGLPVIPEAERPLAVGLPTVAKFVEADAALIVDAREPEAFAEGHIPGAVNVAYDEAVRNPVRIEKLDAKGRPIIVYCSGGTCEASRMLAEMMVRDFGKRRVLVYEGGFPEWAAAGKVVARESR